MRVNVIDFDCSVELCESTNYGDWRCIYSTITAQTQHWCIVTGMSAFVCVCAYLQGLSHTLNIDQFQEVNTHKIQSASGIYKPQTAMPAFLYQAFRLIFFLESVISPYGYIRVQCCKHCTLTKDQQKQKSIDLHNSKYLNVYFGSIFYTQIHQSFKKKEGGRKLYNNKIKEAVSLQLKGFRGPGLRILIFCLSLLCF